MKGVSVSRLRDGERPRSLARVLGASVLLVLGACGSDSDDGPSSAVDGSVAVGGEVQPLDPPLSEPVVATPDELDSGAGLTTTVLDDQGADGGSGGSDSGSPPDPGPIAGSGEPAPTAPEPSIDEPADADPEMPTVQEAPVATGVDPDSRENQQALTNLRRERVLWDCVPFLNTLDVAAGGLAGPSDAWTNGRYRLEPGMFTADNAGEKTSAGLDRPNRLTGASPERGDFGGQNLLFECVHEEYGPMRLFVPKLSTIDGGLASDYESPPWTGTRGRVGEAVLVVTPESDLVYRVYRALAAEETATGGVLDDAAVVRLHREASERVSAVEGLSPEPLVDGQYYSLRGSRPAQAVGVRADLNVAFAPYLERFRTLALTAREARGEITPILEELASQLTGGRGTTDLADLVSAAFFPDRTRSLVGDNADFSNGTEGWTEYDNTASGTSPDNRSELYTLGGEPSAVVMTLVSSTAANEASLQRGIFREVSLQGLDLSNVFLTARYTTLDGRPEETFAGNVDASGVASISIEYLDASDNTLGTTNLLDTADPALSELGFLLGTESLTTNGANVIFRAAQVGNRLVTLNVGEQARRALGSRSNEIAAVRIYGFVGDYIGGDVVTALFGLIRLPRTCNKCSAEVELNSLDVRLLE